MQEMDWTSNKDTQHYVNKNKLLPPFPDDTELAMFGELVLRLKTMKLLNKLN